MIKGNRWTVSLGISRLTQTPTRSSDLNTFRGSISMIRIDNCAPLCSGSLGVRICTLKWFTDSSTRKQRPVIIRFVREVWGTDDWSPFQSDHTGTALVIWISCASFRCPLHQRPEIKQRKTSGTRHRSTWSNDKRILRGGIEKEKLTSKLAISVAHWWIEGLLTRKPSAPMARSISVDE